MLSLKKTLLSITVVIAIVISSFALILFFLSFKYRDRHESLNNPVTQLNCKVREEQRTVRGDSLYPLIKPGDRIEILFNYYDCHPIQRGDVVAYYYAGDKYPLIKIVKGMPGDKFGLEKASSGWNIVVNGKALKNSEGAPYLLPDERCKMLSLYEKDYHNTIPDGAYLILGNITSGSLDSSKFGLVGKRDILGKVVSSSLR